MPLQCVIDLQHPASGVTHDNCYISGFVKLTVEKPTRVSGVTLAVRGKGYCCWEEYTGTGDDRTKVQHYNGERYLNGVAPLMWAPQGQELLVIEPGNYNLPFNMFIPPGMPSSFEHIGAYVRYKLQVCFRRPWKKDVKFDRRFNVYSHVDLNLKPELRNPAIGGMKKNFYTLFIKRGEIDLEVQTVASGFVPGQVIPLHCAFRNDSNVTILHIKFSLNQFIMYTSTIGRVHYMPPITVAQSAVNPLLQQDQMTFDVQLNVPPTVRPSLLSSNIISVTYQLVVRVKVSGLHISPIVRMPLVIGTVPFYNVPGTSAPTQSAPIHLEGPPSYSQATQEKNESTDDEDNSYEKK